VTLAGDGWNGAPQRAPFDRIEVTVGVWDVSPHWIEQLVEGGIFVVPLWLRAGVQASIAFRKQRDRLLSESVRRCGFMRLRGPQAGPEAYVPVGSWLAYLDEVRPGDVELLNALLATNPRAEAITPPPDGWFERLALDHPDAIRLVTPNTAKRDAAGIFDRKSEGLAVIQGGNLRIYGGDEARGRLMQWLTDGETFSLERLHVEAASSAQAHEGWVIRRPELTFVLTGG
jgi:protein-L-isoaspartate(D-aspartate) O-methyltransferase